MWVLVRFDSPAFEATSHIVAVIEILLRNRLVRMTIEAVTAPAFKFHQQEAMGTSAFRHPIRCTPYLGYCTYTGESILSLPRFF
jgi:hypothetical protein